MDQMVENNIVEHVNHPEHYNRKNAIECIEEMIILYGKEETAIFCKLNAHKYRYRAGTKEGNSGAKDLCKSDWYMRKYVELRNEIETDKRLKSNGIVVTSKNNGCITTNF